mgnify:CR=1 FL=1
MEEKLTLSRSVTLRIPICFSAQQFLGEVEQQIVAERTAVDGFVQIGTALGRHLPQQRLRRRERRPRRAGLGVPRLVRVECAHPLWQLRHVVGAGHEAAALRVPPERGIGAVTDGQDRRTIFNDTP